MCSKGVCNRLQAWTEFGGPALAPSIGIVGNSLLIIVVGGTIRINDAGESCPDWPKCFGTLGFDISENEQEEWYNENPDEIDSRGKWPALYNIPNFH